jgi:hypothetical protein
MTAEEFRDYEDERIMMGGPSGDGDVLIILTVLVIVLLIFLL